ncbi:MAG: VanZ family protein [Fermentimonas sp.]|jgi:VanZ family protein
MRHIFRHLLVPFIVALLIFVGTCLITSVNMPNMPQGIPWDKVTHFGMFFVLSMVSLYDYYLYQHCDPKLLPWIFWGFVVPVIYGGAIELFQSKVFTYRNGEILDFVADALGSLCALLLVLIVLKRKPRET